MCGPFIVSFSNGSRTSLSPRRVKSLVSGIALALSVSGASLAQAGSVKLLPHGYRHGVLPVGFHAAIHQPDASSIVVTSCGDDGVGSFRQSIAAAQDGDTVDLSQLACSVITLSTGAVTIGQDNLAIVGPLERIDIDGSGLDRVLVHSGTGTLMLDHLNVVNGTRYLSESQPLDAKGGCIFSAGTVDLQSVTVGNCLANASSSGRHAYGGGVYAVASVRLRSSVVMTSIVSSDSDAQGGAICTPGELSMTDSKIVSNTALSFNGNANGGGVSVFGAFTSDASTFRTNSVMTYEIGSGYARGGGAFLQGDVTISGSSFSDNSALTGGAVEVRGGMTSVRSIINTLIAGNQAQKGAGIKAAGSPMSIDNSTIAFNGGENVESGSGITLENVTATLQSTIVARNGNAAGTLVVDIDGTGVVAGSHNLIVASHLPVPGDTLSPSDPMLQYSPTQLPTVVALRPASAAVDAGTNPHNLEFDQRGPGFARTKGVATDIGAFEAELDDAIFMNGFEE